MKYNFTILFSALIFLSSAIQTHAAGSKAIALALRVKGDVKLTREDKTTSLKFGTPLNHNDKIRTGKDGFITVMFTDDKSQVKLKAHTEVILEGRRGSGGDIAKRVSMEIGELFVQIGKQRGSMEVATPTSVASVKGTEFWVVVDSDGNSYVTTLEGLVELMNRITGEVVEVRPAQKGEVDAQGNIRVEDVPPENIPPDPDPPRDEGQTSTIEIQIMGADGNPKTITIQYRQQERDDD